MKTIDASDRKPCTDGHACIHEHDETALDLPRFRLLEWNERLRIESGVEPVPAPRQGNFRHWGINE